MSVYAVTGKLGNGKSLVCVQRIEESLLAGRKVATNIDINVLAMLKPGNRSSRLIRLPDKPTLFDLESIGQGYEGSSYDEKEFGILVLDELGTWFNSRNWNDKSRQPLIDWFLHARKLRWHVYFIVQDENIIDKQLRESLFEHVVHCRRLDRMKIPLVTPLTSLLGVPVRFPKVHVGVVQYMLSQSSMIVDRWYSFGERCYNFYDTQQVFSPTYSKGPYSVLPPGYLRKPPKTRWNRKNLMRYTKIQGKRYMRPMFIAMVLLVGLLIGDRYLDSSYCNSMLDDCTPEPPPVVETKPPEEEGDSPSLKPSALFATNQPAEQGIDYSQYLDPFHAIASNSDYVQFQGLRATDGTRFAGYLIARPSGQRFALKDVEAMGWSIHHMPGGMFLMRAGNLISVYWMETPGPAPKGPARGRQPANSSVATTHF